EGRVADWVPVFGGDYMALWPIFNIADASIFTGVTIILIRQKVFFVDNKEEETLKSGKVTKLKSPTEI
ncbi:MAG: lipoprotein signal peptidase, partial [Cyclobacteriaceae bacterium]|nr:lipoprotein signal peptidase [Cyclobacteriaceae bacterium]